MPYEEAGVLGSGFVSRETGANTYVVSATGAAGTPWNRLIAIAFARAAEIGIERDWPTFRIVDIRRTAECADLSANRGAGPTVAGGVPRLVISAVYGPPATGPEVRDSTETYAEMRQRLSRMTASEAEKQQIVDWVFVYCASIGAGERAAEPGRERAR